MAFRRLSLWGPLFDAGVVAATVSSALASFLGAPRILQALARDGIFGSLRVFGSGSGGTDNPRRAVCLTAAIAALVFALGGLNTVARLISMFFLISYGLLNWATYVEARGASPAFRPRFRFFRGWLSLIGSMLCVGAILAIDLWMGALAIAVMAGIYRYLQSRELVVTWGDSRPGYNYRRLKDTLREIDRLPVDDQSWQPHILVFGENAERRDLLVRFGAAMSGASGITTSVGIVCGEGDFLETRDRRSELEKTLRSEIESQEVDAFPLAVAVPDLRVAVSTLLQTWGIGPLRANTVLLDWWEHLPESSTATDPRRYGRQVQSILRLGCHLLILDVAGKEFRLVEGTPVEERRIDVWWWEESSCRLSLLLAYLMTRSLDWEGSPIRILAPCRESEDRKVETHLRGVLEQARIDATIEIVPEGTAESLVERSGESAMVFFRMRMDGMRAVDPFGGPLEEMLPKLPIVCIAGAARAVRLTESEDDPTVSASSAHASADRDRQGAA